MSDRGTGDEYRQVASQDIDMNSRSLDALYHDAMRYRETDPEHQLALLTQGRDEALRLNEPGVALFFESWRLTTLTSDLCDFARAHPLAIELMVRVSKPEFQGHSDEASIWNNVLCTYVEVDPIGHRDDLERGFSHLDQKIAKGPVQERFVLNYRWVQYLCYTQRWKEAYDRAQHFQALVGRGRCSPWWQCWALFLLCKICNALEQVDFLADYAKEMVEKSQQGSQLVRTRAAGMIWLAVANRIRGKEREASRDFHEGMRYISNVSSRDEICADAISKYYELANDWKAAIAVRDRELSAISKKGMSHRCCVVEIELCRLRLREGNISDADFRKARIAAEKMRVPSWYLNQIVELEMSQGK